MDALHTQALLIRHAAAVPLIKQYDEHGRLCLLEMIVAPNETVLEASLARARAQGVTLLAVEIAAQRVAEAPVAA
jgi:hypothetical protein